MEHAASMVALVDAMLRAIVHRGPDAQSTRTLEGPHARRATLGAVRLRIIDIAATADQPMSDGEGRVWTTFNGELYNYKELRAELTAAGFRFRTAGDTECLVHLWRHLDGDVERLASRLRGMFAFAIWDTETGRFAMARDRLGIKPAYWVPTPTGLAFCSEQRALARAGLVDGSLNHDVLAGFLTKGVVPAGDTILRSVQSLAPGSFLGWDGTTPTIGRWWRPMFTLRADLLDRERARDETEATLTDAVKRHLVADRAVGVFLSSGVDSTAVATVAARSGAQRSLTVRFPDEPDMDEGNDAAATAQRLGLQHQEVPTTGADAQALLPSFLASLDSPTSDGFNSWLVCRAAHETGTVVALSGLGGDELFAGYRTFRLVPRLRRILPLIRRVPDPVRYAAARALRANDRTRPFARALATGSGPAAAYHAMRGLFDGEELSQLGLSMPALFSATATHAIDTVTLLELGSYLRDQLLPDADTTSMAHSVELRVPLLDDRVVAMALALPPSVRRDGKQLLAAASGQQGNRGAKRTFTLPLDRWIQGPLRDTVRAAVLDDHLAFGDALAHDFRERLWRDFEARRAHWSKVWAIAVLRLWPEANGFAS